MNNIQTAQKTFREHYVKRLQEWNGSVPVIEKVNKMEGNTWEMYYLSPNEAVTNPEKKLKKGNGPRIFHHGTPTKDVIILTHGLSDSPFYMEAIGKRFVDAGCNVVLPLLPAHGLEEPENALEDKSLAMQWRATVDNAVEVARLLGHRISLGGFSTGGALSLNRILREAEKAPEERFITGGLFLFSAALSVGWAKEMAGRSRVLEGFAYFTENDIKGIGQDPYKYPRLPMGAGFELVEIINENKRLIRRKKIPQPVFAAHSAHDNTAKFDGITRFIEHHIKQGVALLIKEEKKVEHGCLTLDKKITLNEDLSPPPEYDPIANPKFDWMMDNCIQFFTEEVKKT